MKKLMTGLMLISITVFFVSCSEDDSNNTGSTQDLTAMANTAKTGNWRITYFFDTDTDETSNFTGYVFNFKDGGTVTASNGTRTVNGTWSITDSNSSGSSSDDADFNIFFNVPQDDDFEDLNDDWDIVSINANKIELIDVSGGNGGTDNLRFEKN